tara:strand:- start:7250 stop:8299 length:1050 start_codon:yes stop_codon:yes gene_type:complete
MFTQGFGEVLTDLLTTNPALADLPSASAILDTSNYTFNAITYGKDAQGFNFHGHTLSSTQHVLGNISKPVSGFNDGNLIVKRYNAASPSSYFFSSTYYEFSSTYNSVPRYPSPKDVRLELESTLTTNASAWTYASELPDVGHYPNAAVSQNLSAAWNVVGGFPPYLMESMPKLYLVDEAGGLVTSGTLSGVYNEFGLVDSNGYVKINEGSGFDNGLSSLTPIQGGALSGGPCVFSGLAGTDGITRGQSLLAVVPQLGDAASLAAFGGVSHIGVWCLDLKEMLASGLMPPYSWDHLNNNRKYKLVSKVTFWDNLLSHEDIIPFSGLFNGLGDSLGLSNQGPLFVLKFNFT